MARKKSRREKGEMAEDRANSVRVPFLIQLIDKAVLVIGIVAAPSTNVSIRTHSAVALSAGQEARARRGGYDKDILHAQTKRQHVVSLCLFIYKWKSIW